MPVYPIPSPLPPVAVTPSHTAQVHFSAAEFFRDSPWLNVPPHRKTDIRMEPLYPRMGLLGGAQEGGGGKVSKLAALAAARKKKEGEKTPSGSSTPATTAATPSDGSAPGTPSTESTKGTQAPLSLRERLAGNGKPQKSSEGLSSLRSLGKGSPAPTPLEKKPSSDTSKPKPASVPLPDVVKKEPLHTPEQPKSNIRAQPSSFASTIVGDSIRPQMTGPSHLHSNTVDLMRIYGQDHAEPFDFAGPSPDDVVTNAQSSAKGLTFRTKV